MTCWKKNSQRKIKRYKKKSVIYPDKIEKEIVPIQSFNPDERIKCGGCNECFGLSSNELKIHCNLCCQFFHCKIAGKCDGENCKIIGSNGQIHRASYCYDCSGLISKTRILCKDCLLDTHLEKKI